MSSMASSWKHLLVAMDAARPSSPESLHKHPPGRCSQTNVPEPEHRQACVPETENLQMFRYTEYRFHRKAYKTFRVLSSNKLLVNPCVPMHASRKWQQTPTSHATWNAYPWQSLGTMGDNMFMDRGSKGGIGKHVPGKAWEHRGRRTITMTLQTDFPDRGFLCESMI
jgi:hypothetical protein